MFSYSKKYSSQDLVIAELLGFSANIMGKLTQHVCEKENALEPGVIS